jgi:PAS domain S-box-containing protein
MSPRPSTAASTIPSGLGLESLVAAAPSLFDKNPDVVAIADRSGTVVYCNGANDLPPGAEDARRQVLLTGTTARVELAARAFDGTPGWMLLTTTPLVTGGVLSGVLQQGTDISERRREEQRLRRSEALMVDTQGVAQIGIWEWDVTQPHATWSPGLYAIYGLSPETYTPSYDEYLKRVHPDDRQRVMDATNRVFHQHEPYSHDERVFRSDGTIRHLHTWAMPVLDDAGKLVRLMGVCQDITDRKRAENAVAEHAADLARSNVELEQFAHFASHDLQEPLRSVASFVQLLERRYRGRLDDDADEAIHFAVEGVRRMKALIGDSLAYLRVRTGPLQLTAFPLGEAIARAMTGLRPTIDENGSTVQVGDLPSVRAEQGLIVSLLQNLLVNAIKFRGADNPDIRIEAGPTERGFVEIVVRDNGIGVPVAHRERIFEMFQRLDPDKPGTGIGLAICRKIVERHGGRIWVDGPAGPGTTFRFTLPLAAERRPA